MFILSEAQHLQDAKAFITTALLQHGPLTCSRFCVNAGVQTLLGNTYLFEFNLKSYSITQYKMK